MKKNIFLFVALISGHAIAMELSKTHLFIIPALGDSGGENIETVLPYFKKNKELVHRVHTVEQFPYVHQFPDFGQNNCQKDLTEKIDWLKENDILYNYDHMILHGSSQGTATAINYAAKNPNNVTCLILESIILSGNRHIDHTFTTIIWPPLQYLPAHYYIPPYTTRIGFPWYSPVGEQPINNVYNLPKDLPIIIVHDPKDGDAPFEDAQALYAFLTFVQKNKKVYLITPKSKKGEHINLLTKTHTKEISAINAILKKHYVLSSHPKDPLDTDLKPYQPEAQLEWLDHFYDILNKETNLQKYIDPTIKKVGTVGACALLYALSCYLGIM
jgi:hypothetical protein